MQRRFHTKPVMLVVLAFILAGGIGLFTLFTQNKDREFRRFGIDQLAAIGIGSIYTVTYHPCGGSSPPPEIPALSLPCPPDSIVCAKQENQTFHRTQSFSALGDADAIAFATERKPKWCELGHLFRDGTTSRSRIPDFSNRIDQYGG